jgi:hypothetical protein
LNGTDRTPALNPSLDRRTSLCGPEGRLGRVTEPVKEEDHWRTTIPAEPEWKAGSM